MEKMMEATFSVFCGASAASSSCIYQSMVVFFNVVLLLVLLFALLRRKSSVARFRNCSSWEICSSIFNICLGFTYLGFGAWKLEEKWRKTHTALPLSSWFSTSFHGLTWIAANIIVISQRSGTILRLFSGLAVAFSALVCASSMASFMNSKVSSMEMALNVLSFPGAVLLMLVTYKKDEFEAAKDLYTPLNGREDRTSPLEDSPVTPFASAGILSRSSFWWLNSLLKTGREKTLGDDDVPKLRRSDRAESCYTKFLEKSNEESSLQPSLLKTMILCHWKEVLLSGFFALSKILTVSAGPLLLNAFISVAEGNSSFNYEGYVLAASLFLSKTVESLSQRQWYFTSRLTGLRVRSTLTAAIFKKQLKLSNAGKSIHSGGEIMNYVTVDAYRIGEFPYWFHQTWTTGLQLFIVVVILYRAVGPATIAALITIILCVLGNAPVAKLQHKYQTRLMQAQDERLRACNEALINMKVLKSYAWETHFKKAIEKLREIEFKWLSGVQLRKSYNGVLFWTSPVLVSVATFGACYFFNVPLNARNVFTFVATLRLVQDPIRTIPDVISVVIQAKVSFARVSTFLKAPELHSAAAREERSAESLSRAVVVNSADFSWEESSRRPTLKNIDLVVRPGEKVAICGEVGSGKSTLLAAVLGEISKTKGEIRVSGKIAYVSQTAWIQTGTIRDNVLFGADMNPQKYRATLETCSLAKDLESFPYGDETQIGERGVNLSGGQKQRIQLARALYQDADLYLLDDPFSAVDAHTATNLFNDYVMKALSEKTVLLVTHQVDFLRTFDSVLLMSDGEIMQASCYDQLLATSKEFQELVNAHKHSAGTERLADVTATRNRERASGEIKMSFMEKKASASDGNQLISKEEREEGDTGLKPYIQYLNQSKGFLYFSLSVLSHLVFVVGQTLQNYWMAFNVDNPDVTPLHLIVVYLVIGVTSIVFLLTRALSSVSLGLESSRSLFSQLANSLFRAPMSFYDATPVGRILSRVSSDLSVVDVDLPFAFVWASGATINVYAGLAVLAVITWQLLIVSVPMLYISMLLKSYYFATAKELMRISGTTKSLLANHVAESVAGAVTIRAFKEEDRFFAKNLCLIDENSSPFFHSFSAIEWLIQRLEMLSTSILTSAALAIVLLPHGTFSPGFIGMALSYGLSLNTSWVLSIQNQCTLANYIISVERVNQYMHIRSEAPEIIEQNRPPSNWPSVGKVEILDLQIRYRPNAPLVLRGISCTFEGGHKIGIVGRTGSGKTTLIGALFRLVEPAGGRIVVDGIDICSIGLHDLRSRFGIIPQDPTLFSGTVRYNLDPLSQHSDQQLWEVLGKCQLREPVQEKGGLDSPVMEEGSNWSMGQRQLFCLGRALLRRSRILVLDEATASIDNATDMILQKTIRSEFADCTVITVAHRIPTVMDSTMILGISDGEIVEYDEPEKLMKMEDSLFGELVKEYWSRSERAE